MTVERSLERLRSSLAGLSPSQTRALVEEARAEARARVLSRLIDELSELMLEQLLDELTPGAPDSSAPSEEELGWYVYGVIGTEEAGPPASLPGIDPSHPTTTVDDERLAAVVSRVSLADFDEEPLRERLTDMEWLERTARVHEEVLELIGRQGTVIPMRICSIYRDQTGVREMLRREAGALHAALRHLGGRTEWGLKVFADRTAVAHRPAPPESSTDEGTAAEGTAYLRRRRREHQALERLDQVLEDACQEIHSRLRAIASDALTSPVQRPEVTDHPGEMVHNGAYLVGDDDYAVFVDEIDRLRERFESLELVLTGPWPPYNFVPGAIGAAW
jgi:Gas vesicle synthesis protein GvpL/GvpF